ncbi:MAG: hypothetical protein PHR77_03055 [Kiritimatiellae bacterium]|nr:hypothetical protein [Kiritimatiellia bacterium]MDD5521044.1 hypothetical protein [Kiritimatiellia bacterium]
MNDLEKIAVLENEVQARVLESLLKDRGIPFIFKSYHDLALDGLYQVSKGWGHIEAPVDFKEEILEIIQSMNKEAAEDNSRNHT